jgi:hypothetical protein
VSTPPWPAEFPLVAACSRWPPSADRDAAIRAAAPHETNWPRLQRIAARQRVEGLVQAGLTAANIASPPALRARAMEVAARSLAQAVETARLQALLRADGIACLALKGAAVEKLAYGRLGLKDAWDIDLLVEPAAAPAALRRLDEAGYALVEPSGLRTGQIRVWVALAKECELANRESGMRVELHWGLADGPVLLAGLSVTSPSQTVAIAPGLALVTLAPEETFAHLCVHGALHGWSRLKWLADLAGILSHEGVDGVERLYRRSLELGAGLCSAQALLLCGRLLAMDLPDALEAELRSRPLAGWLESVALTTMTGAGAERELEARPFARTRVLLAELALPGTPSGVWRQLRYRSVSVTDRVRLPLPRGLGFLYWILRAPLWLWRRFRELAPGPTR